MKNPDQFLSNTNRTKAIGDFSSMSCSSFHLFSSSIFLIYQQEEKENEIQSYVCTSCV